MEVTHISYSKTKQVSEYEPETIKMDASLDEGDDAKECIQELRSVVEGSFGGGATVAKKKTSSRRTKAKEAEVVEEEEEEVEEAPKRTKKKVTKKASAGGGSKKKTTKKKAPARTRKKNVAYDRTVKAHADVFAEILHDNFEGWTKDDELKVLAKKTSVSLVGEDFMDGEGNVLESFVDLILEGMGADDSDL